MERPRIREIEPIPAQDGKYYLRDPRRFSDVVLSVEAPVLRIISLFDGTRSIVDIQAEYARLTGDILFRETLEKIIGALDRALFLDNERAAQAQALAIRAYHESPVRAAMNAGLSYPGTAQELTAFLGELFAAAGERESADLSDLEAVVAPHIDFGRGGSCYAAAYRELALRCRARRFVVLGVSHHPTLRRFALTRKDYDTPLGPVRTDPEMVDALRRRLSADFLADDIAHRNEHSVEFQILLLGYLFGGHSELCAPREISVLPILCSSLHEQMLAGAEPGSGGEVEDFLGALADVLGDRGDTCLVAAVDFAHLGRQFGQQLEVTDELLEQARRDDEAMLRHVRARDAQAFLAGIAAERDRRNVCGVPALYALLRLLGRAGAAGTLLRYGQAADRQSHSVVTFAGMLFPRSAT